MSAKNVAVPVAILIALGVAILNYLVRDFDTVYPIFNMYMKFFQPYLVSLAIFCFLAPSILLLTYILSPANSRRFNESVFHNLLKSLTHLSAIVAIILNFGWLWAFYLIYGFALGIPLKLLLIVGAVVVLVVFLIIDALSQKYLDAKWYNVFHWVTRSHL